MGWGKKILSLLIMLALVAPIMIQGVGWGGGWPLGVGWGGGYP